MNYSRHIITSSCLFGVTFALDRFTKWWAVNSCKSEYIINRYLSCELTFNRGLSWGFLDSPHWWTFLFISCVIGCVIIGFTMSVYQLYRQKKNLLGSALVLAGALGNFIDRIIYGGVVDFISIGSFPVFNVADIAICCGIGIMIIMHRDQL